MNWCSHRIQSEVLFFEFLSVQKCQAKGQKLKLLRMKVSNIVNLLNLSKYRPKRLSIFSCSDAFLQIELIECQNLIDNLFQFLKTYFYNLHWNNYLYFKGLLYI